MDEGRMTLAVQRYLDELAGARDDAPTEPVVRAPLARAVGRLHFLCASLLARSYPRLTYPPLNLDADEMLGAVAERLIKAMRQVRPTSVRQFFALATRHIRWELNDVARRLDGRPAVAELHESLIAAARAESGGSRPDPVAGRILRAIEDLPEDAREAFSLVRIHGMTHAEAAEVLGVAA